MANVCPYCGSTGRRRRIQITQGVGPIAKSKTKRCSWSGHGWG